MLKQETVERCEATVRQYDAQVSLLANAEFCTGYSRAMEADRTRQRLAPVVVMYGEYQRLVSDVQQSAEMLRLSSPQERMDVQELYG